MLPQVHPLPPNTQLDQERLALVDERAWTLLRDPVRGYFVNLVVQISAAISIAFLCDMPARGERGMMGRFDYEDALKRRELRWALQVRRQREDEFTHRRQGAGERAGLARSLAARASSLVGSNAPAQRLRCELPIPSLPATEWRPFAALRKRGAPAPPASTRREHHDPCRWTVWAVSQALGSAKFSTWLLTAGDRSVRVYMSAGRHRVQHRMAPTAASTLPADQASLLPAAAAASGWDQTCLPRFSSPKFHARAKSC
ncbi:hypothetical protein PHYSODRAFT_306443 [Phytophthora sojae]|uniref:Uncharacterized protein n=1 Tax=Phytophthora sojae (strain P6497) TaxID=1094619 RepID=G5AB61_PHYSP|nr:hypothetical protein PHYSODRAFT_306443 [Phytophthora sojae]EGZ07206.1 hypothetical protein PHYSODRAFT_306443 [Phytophthora sojae]|eukprot:XP_009536772.1 hypothetical protein PHYSODRAFT_306443 [Phytophthora sojae]